MGVIQYLRGRGGKVGVLTRGGLIAEEATRSRKVWPSRQKSAEGIVGRLDAAEGPNTGRGWRLNLDGESAG